MTIALLIMLVGGIALTQAVSDPAQVTLRWLRLGGIISVALLGVAVTTGLVTDDDADPVVWAGTAAVTVVAVAQLMTVQLGWRRTQRVLAAATFVAAAAAVVPVLVAVPVDLPFDSAWPRGETDPPAAAVAQGRTAAVAISAPLSAGLLGGFLMTMLLGHAYLTSSDEMSQAPFRRLVLLLALLLLARALVSAAAAAWPYFAAEVPRSGRVWNTAMILARFGVGLIVPGVFVYMVYDCVRRRADQSATGILYVTTVLVIVGEGAAAALFKATGWVF